MTAADFRPARSYSSSPSSTQIVVWKEERLLLGASQFQPPSSSCSPISRIARASFGSSKYAPMPKILPLMHGSVSPWKKGRLFSPLNTILFLTRSSRSMAFQLGWKMTPMLRDWPKLSGERARVISVSFMSRWGPEWVRRSSKTSAFITDALAWRPKAVT